MAQGRDSPTGYDWEGSAVPEEPRPLTLPGPAHEPSRGEPAVAGEPQDPADEAPRRGGLPAWSIVAIVLVQAVALVAVVALVTGGLQRLGEREPATLGEHTVSWTTWTGGTLAVTALEVDLEATAPGAEGRDVVQDGYRLVLATYEVLYDGPGQLTPAEELWLTGESDRTYFPDVGEGLVPDPMKQVGPLASSRSATFHAAFVVPTDEIDTFRLGVETFSGEILYFGT
ncbi:MAG: hypothetical protein GX960_15865 [Actinomycetales bacterium]|nr:hypothetical protein [Actinomycetales bacterium]